MGVEWEKTLIVYRLATVLFTFLFVSTTASALTPGFQWDRYRALSFKLVNDQCLPKEIIDNLVRSGQTLITAKEYQSGCCPHGLYPNRATEIDPETWRQVVPFVIQEGDKGPTTAERCPTIFTPMTDLPNVIAAHEKAEAQVKAELDAAEQAKKQAEQLAKEQAAAKEVERLKAVEAEFLAGIPTMGSSQLCTSYGAALRENTIPELYQTTYAKVAAMLATEIKKRKLLINPVRAKKTEFRIGDTTCTLHAAWGLPERANRSVSAYGERTQHVYGRVYVYTANGIITSWQD